MKLIPLPAFTDNYIWMLHDGHRALVVDPGDARPVLAALQAAGLHLESILVTHHHADHTGGVEALRMATGARVVGPAKEPVPQPFDPLTGGDCVEAAGARFDVLDVPGHTRGHIAYFCSAVDGVPLLFCGDTLFSAGCGRLFEGTPAQMQASLARLAALPAATQVCCAHEYTLGNLKFALEVEPGNQNLIDYAATCKQLRARGAATLPSSIGQERAINPFLRTGEAAVMASVNRYDSPGVAQHGVFATLREWKNQYR